MTLDLSKSITRTVSARSRNVSGMVTGAGDAFLAALSFNLSRDIHRQSINLEKCIHSANEIAAMWIEKNGTF